MDLEITQMQVATHTFHLLHHRNKNQHRHSKWWKWFSMLKHCLSKLIHEIQARDILRAQARVKHMYQVLLPRCYACFTQLIQDSQFSSLGLTLVAELSRIRRLVAPYTDQAEDRMDPAMELVDSKDNFPLNLSEDFGEAVRRTTSSHATDVGVYSALAFDILTGPERGRGAEKRLREREGAGPGVKKTANGEIESPQPEPGNAIAGFKPCASSAPTKRQRQRKPVNAIDDLFQGLN
ncbi:hypothetical protein HO173_000283 [Letharia columbiana]|uniref:RNase MRP protein 1 RNA binding domain-containing protein n=1 Tax=Letharia columbiana TaxID=112416 RepID=A0A8H6LAH4_9LECA|nr:uncharacterized protein HO173_000283 [Letharia columbiana]KAF6241572.1 hypothetical protein HO173_000283 [Letharia columbiana]